MFPRYHTSKYADREGWTGGGKEVRCGNNGDKWNVLDEERREKRGCVKKRSPFVSLRIKHCCIRQAILGYDKGQITAKETLPVSLVSSFQILSMKLLDATGTSLAAATISAEPPSAFK